MKNLPEIWSRWDSGNFLGANKAYGVVTVEPGWSLRSTTQLGVGQSNYLSGRPGPWRYFQTTSGTLTSELVIPTVKSVNIDRSIDTDAASATITLYNQKLDALNDVTLPGQLGQPGYYTWNRGASPDALARWNQEINEWANVLTPMALLRTYEGYGAWEDDGTPMYFQDALTAGLVTRTGTWLVDKVTVGSNGLMTLTCRDMTKLLLEQLLYPPVVPTSMNPLKYYRYKDTTYNAIWDPGAGLVSGGNTPIKFTYAVSSSDVIAGDDTSLGLGQNHPVLGFLPSNSCDNDESTVAIGYGFNTFSSTSYDWWEYMVGSQQMNRVYVSPSGGGYTVYISVYEGGAWQGDQTINYAPGEHGDYAAGIPYVVSSGVSRNTPVTIELPRTYAAQRVRITFGNLKQENPAVDQYRSALAEVAGGLSNLTAGAWTFALARHPNNGYWAISANGQQFYFGDARQLTKNDTVGIDSTIVAAEGHLTQPGFWTLEQNGRVHAYGASQHFGDASTSGADDFIDIAVTHTNNGYWLLRRSGGVYTYGDAAYMSGTFLGSTVMGELPSASDISKTATAIAGHPTVLGYWITDALGQVGNFGGATFYGEVTPPRPANGGPGAIEPTEDGAGYWILWGNGQIFNYGNAQNMGQAVGGGFTTSGYGGIYFDLVRTNAPLVSNAPGAPLDQGYWVLRADGTLVAIGANYFGHPGGTDATERSDGNYLDYVQIIYDLLGWSGFGAYNTTADDLSYRGINGILGIIESTGVFAEEPLTEDVFDKKPVMDAIRTIAEVVGYITYTDEDGGFHFVAPNVWAPGNFWEDGTRASFIPDVDETRTLFEHSVEFNDDSLRSEIIISNALPTEGNTNTITTRYVPPGQELLRGMSRPAMWVNEVFNRPSEQQIMAELIGLYIWFALRQGNVSCTANPAIQINDQVRIWERTTSESYVHYVRGVSTQHDFETGEYVMSLTTHWLGSESEWAVRAPGSASTSTSVSISQPLSDYLANTGSEAANPIYFTGGG